MMGVNMRNSCFQFMCLVAVPVLLSSNVHALPFNDDMVESQISSGQVMRQKVEGTVSLGSVATHTANKAEAESLKNPMPATSVSIDNGKRLFEANCSACHGEIKPDDPAYVPPIVKYGMPAPNLGASLYHQSDNPSEGRSDGNIFGTIRHGNVIMPALGYKLSANEIWDIVNYVRKRQEG